MNDDQLKNNIRDLIQLDIDAAEAYQQAIEKIDDESIRETIERFQGDHERHVESLSGELTKLGGEPPERQADIQGKLLSGMTSLRSITGTSGALSAMQTNEELTNRRYREATEWSTEAQIPFELRRVILKNYDDERRHLQYINDTLRVLSSKG